MSAKGGQKKLSSVLLYEAQALFLTARPVVRYPIALMLAAVAAYMFKFTPHADSGYMAMYLMLAGVYAWELSIVLAVMAALIGAFKFLAMLPLGIAVVVVAVVILYIGV